MADINFHALQNGSDIRGVAIGGVEGEAVNLTPAACSLIAQGFLVWLCQKTGKAPEDLTITIGRDPRLSGESLLQAFTDGLKPFGTHTIDCGLASTPAMFMSTVFPEIHADGAVMVTASHLPFNRNGLKFFSKDGGLDKKDIARILTAAENNEKPAALRETASPANADSAAGASASAASSAQASASADAQPDLMDLYSAHLRGLIQKAVPGEKPLSGLKIAVDCGNGAGGFYVSKVLQPLGADTSASQFLEPDGSFPNHIPNPENEAAMAAITGAVNTNHCDLGIIFDTDVDRSSAVDEQGREINRNGIVAMAAALIADEYPGTTVVTDSITSNELTDYLENRLKLHHLRFKRGYRNVINKAAELNAKGTDAQLAIETSGHAAYKENYFLDDGAYLATRIIIRLAQLKREGKEISSVIAELKEPEEAVEIRMPITEEDHNAAGTAILNTVEAWAEKQDAESSQNPDNGSGLQIHLVKPNYEGVRVQFGGNVQGWFLLRKSLHDPIMPLNIEAEEKGGCRQIAAELYKALENVTGMDTEKLTAFINGEQ
ncbi:MAG: phosphomannomutase/phosphoglucomutase [Eubacterium sp.]|jgi:phosphomannomutase|nr:phosphomannomutase/phosphoglucomutase [Eubacterium sp.]MCH4046850.1 phosphomannomutase/phosphoglucomutase [Eubacterium sp.]MCH4079947.1 phosphomannomutase/phosphoglucomutase [Eubacterium sp.]MCH4110011.1 phosphomannomutase/phosphoglucomutase [Eubacterium sp.]MCI1306566.1 phosphomannomutase/phosphoglucomutase [Eubacterium sp.]